jgi:adenylyltransferase/sulfurtransferase
MHSQISAVELLNRLNTNSIPLLIDVREPVEFHTFNIGGVNIPLGQLKEAIGKVGHNKTDEIIVICSAGLRSETAAKQLTDKGYQNIKNLSGGLLALRKLMK